MGLAFYCRLFEFSAVNSNPKEQDRTPRKKMWPSKPRGALGPLGSLAKHDNCHETALLKNDGFPVEMSRLFLGFDPPVFNAFGRIKTHFSDF
jgi:hypothetical protein